MFSLIFIKPKIAMYRKPWGLTWRRPSVKCRFGDGFPFSLVRMASEMGLSALRNGTGSVTFVTVTEWNHFIRTFQNEGEPFARWSWSLSCKWLCNSIFKNTHTCVHNEHIYLVGNSSLFIIFRSILFCVIFSEQIHYARIMYDIPQHSFIVSRPTKAAVFVPICCEQQSSIHITGTRTTSP